MLVGRVYADSDEADEIREVVIPRDAWTYDSGPYAGREYLVRYPGLPAQRDTGYGDVTQVSERVVVLSRADQSAIRPTRA